MGKKWQKGEARTRQVVGQVRGCYVFVQSCNLKCLTVSFWLYCYTSSTAQGGGGSFKNGKPIGEVSWCDAKMAERTH